MDYKSVVANLIKSDELDKSEILAALAPTQDEKNGDLYKKDSMDLKKYDSFADFGTLLWTLLINGAV